MELTEHEAARRFRAAVDAAGGQHAFAAAHGVTTGYINDLVHGRRKLNSRVLAWIGVEVETVTVYRERDKCNG